MLSSELIGNGADMGRAAAGVGRERVLDAALDLFARNGVTATSLQAIADHLGLTKAAIYHHFPPRTRWSSRCSAPGCSNSMTLSPTQWRPTIPPAG
ncbi:TetR/AcrR family transcriptional regulator [Tessaracoccus coleopterorum]|uniref:TetR/AcrR family transcriptional regulator n=1 Tax=Tessaracoccus coleopterorum TaxID=2714950 RepID=UPI0018D41762|nr:helix-turn-helix domain-containing protein [Tessaracoccus coleopterorum]